MDAQDFRSLQEAYLDVYEQEITLKGTGPRLVDPYADSSESKSGGKMKGPKMKNVMKKEETDLYDIIFSHLINEGYADTKEAAELIMVNMSEEWKETILEITGGKGHPGYKAGSRDLGPMQSGHPADSSKRTMKVEQCL